MQIGLLWFDNSPSKGMHIKIEEAARRYREKFGSAPNTCYVNRAVLALSPQALSDLDVRVVPANNILPHHFWVGVEDPRD